MKKFLLFAVVAVTALAASAQMNLTKAWETAAPVLANTRQGVALDGKYLINNKVEGKVYAYDENGAAEMFETGATASWPAIAKDEAGNVIVRVDNSWPGNFMADTVLFKIFPAGGGDPIAVEGNIFADFEAENGRADYIGGIEGNVMEEGVLWLVTAKSTGIMKVPFVEGEIDGDHIALIPVNGASNFANTGAVVEPWTAADGTKHYMLYWRGINPYDMVYSEDDEAFNATAFTLPGRANLTGIKPFVRDGKNLVVYSLKPADRNYGDGFAIAEMNAEEPLFSVEDTGKDLNNGGICTQWFDIEGDKLFQYAGAQYIACYEFASEEPAGYEEFYLVGTFNGWSQVDGMVAFAGNEAGTEYTATIDLEADAEFKVITPDGEGWKWFGGQDDNNVGYFLLTDAIEEIALVDGANIKVENAGNYTFTIKEAALAPESKAVAEPLIMTVTKNEPEAITTIGGDVKGDNAWYNLQGVKFNGMPSVPGIYINNGKKVVVK